MDYLGQKFTALLLIVLGSIALVWAQVISDEVYRACVLGSYLVFSGAEVTEYVGREIQVTKRGGV